MYHLIRSLYLHATSKEEYSILLLGLDNAGKTTLLSQIRALYQTSDPSIKPGDAPPSSTAGDTVPTVGQNVVVIDLPDMYIKIWDVGGQMTLRRLWSSYYSSCHAVVFVVDSSDLGALEEEELNAGLSLKSPRAGWHGRRKGSYAFPMTEERDEKGEGTASTEPTTPITPGMLGGSYERGRLEECKAVLESVLGHPDTNGVPVLVLANKQDREDCLEVVRIKEGFVRPVFEGEKGDRVRDSRVLPVSALKGTGVKEAVEWIRSRVVWNKLGRPPVMR